MTTTTTPRPDLPLPAGATHVYGWQADGSREVEGPSWHLDVENGVAGGEVYVSCLQWVDGRVDGGVMMNLETAQRITPQQARERGQALIAAADEAEKVAR